ncbi:MAG: hypothetical protein V1874_11520 [Spirochaetota bacterium]
MKSFGFFVKDARVERGITLREFCRINKLDPSNWSKIERGVLPPPKSREVLNEIAKSLKLKTDSEEYNTLFDLAAISYIPKELLTNQEALDKLPVFFRTLRGEKPTRSELEQILKIIKDDHS